MCETVGSPCEHTLEKETTIGFCDNTYSSYASPTNQCFTPFLFLPHATHLTSMGLVGKHSINPIQANFAINDLLARSKIKQSKRPLSMFLH